MSTDYDDEIVSRCAPRWAWEVIDEALSLDMNSSAADQGYRKLIRGAYEAMIQACEEAT